MRMRKNEVSLSCRVNCSENDNIEHYNIEHERDFLFVYGCALCSVNTWHFSDIAAEIVEMDHGGHARIGVCHRMDVDT